MPTLDEAVAKFKEKLDEIGFHYHDELYHAIAKYLGPTNHHKDASLVACSDPKELETVKKNFLIGKLGLEDGPQLDHAIEQACGGLGKSNRHKHRASFYYLLVAILNQEEHFLEEMNK